MKQITILGSTGTIGVNTLDVVQRNPESYQVFALTANKNIERLVEQAAQFSPQFVVIVDASLQSELQLQLDAKNCQSSVLVGAASLVEVAEASQVDMVMAGIVGAAGLLPTLAAAKSGKRVLLANKESLVMSGQLLIDAVESGGGELLPIDSEHNAIFQCLPDNNQSLVKNGVKRILLTASGGPFRTRDLSTFGHISPEEAVAHPNWVMGQKISVDSATMMNKGLEVIEAHWLFGTAEGDVEVLIHPESLIHSMVEYIDGSVLAQLGNPDMRTPIAHAMSWPKRMVSGDSSLDFLAAKAMTFETPDLERFPCLTLSYSALAEGGTAPAILNAANEVAVSAFLQKKLRFTQIPQMIEHCLSSIEINAADELDQILADDQLARQTATQWLSETVE